MILLDTDVVSETFKSRPSPAVARWIASYDPDDLCISVISFGEIERGIEKMRQRDPQYAARLSAWAEVQIATRKHVLLVNLAIAQRWGALSDQIGNKNVDLLIAATALTYGLTVATRNVRHFRPTGVHIVNPFAP